MRKAHTGPFRWVKKTGLQVLLFRIPRWILDEGEKVCPLVRVCVVEFRKYAQTVTCGQWQGRENRIWMLETLKQNPNKK